MLKKDLQGWFTDRPAISTRQFGIEAGWPDGGYFRRWLKEPAEEAELVSQTILKKILPILERYGYNTTKN